MIRNYLKTAWRNLVQNKTTSFISMAGLAVGICSFLLLATYLTNELRYDRFNTNAGRISRLTFSYKSADDKEVNTTALTPTAPVPVFKQQLADIEDGVRVVNYSNMRAAVVQFGDKLFKEKKMLVADASFFKIFTFKFLSGNPATALANSTSIVLTASTAEKYFGDEDAMGKILKVDQKNSMIVTGVIEDVPEYSQIKFDMMGSYAMMPRSLNLAWSSSNDYSYILLKPGANREAVAKQMTDYINKDRPASGGKMWFGLEPLTRVHLYSTAGKGLEPSGNIKYVYILGFVAIVLLVLACVNFLNLVTARSAERAKEIGVRKVMGAMRGQLFVQFIAEAGIITLFSLIAGVLLLSALLPVFSNFTGQQLSLQTWNPEWLILALVTLFVVVTLLAGTYPSLYLSAFKPIVTLKGGSSMQAGGNMLRKSLVVFQFVVSVFFIISTIIAGNQLRYIQSLNTGINRDQVLVLDLGGMGYNQIESFKGEIGQQTGVLGSTASYDSPVNVGGGYSINTAEGKNADFNLSVTAIPVEKSFTKTLGIKLIAGNDLDLGDEQQVMDTSADKRRYSFILNEAAVKGMGWKPEQAIGKKIGLNGRMGTIKAVAKDFNFASLHEEITPIVMFPEYDWFGKLLVKTSGKNTANTIAAIASKWHKFYPNSPFEYHFLDQEFDAMYKTDQRTGGILTAFTVVTILISCLGLFGLAVFSTRQRIKEIGIRKVLGAGVASIAGLISFDFIKLVLIAIVISSPLAWFAMNKWLQDFAFRVSIQWWVFVLAGGMAALIAFLTVGYQSIKAALSNPVKSLRSE
ncbi:ABC transporter permease [Mucilaginibacter phyllosphaerae]|uniref:ABC transport system permease protein n=1 Tax=Mucilaginibacter phyllosphaerae TaxID=1812349 RepID=A0A4Y8A7G1_9SPHI|nr:ABC transporter permease [Mucilaginibacter phyllosphaerae]MBB3970795.1 putative ABC transport system permease protein [Mucilaginibacter phyllosphaerae]TEW64265.1 ABC transporter permease [Mucilaginibacter phyllosphaerae]GGH04650.1 ABC transporter permease [Mucilaginibacter phyllosphaerae]